MDKLIEKLINWAETIGDIAATELPLFAQEIIAYKTWDAYIGFYFFLFSSILFVILFAITLKANIQSRIGEYTGLSFSFLILFILSFIITVSNFCEIKKCELAPRLVILETLKKQQ